MASTENHSQIGGPNAQWTSTQYHPFQNVLRMLKHLTAGQQRSWCALQAEHVVATTVLAGEGLCFACNSGFTGLHR